MAKKRELFVLCVEDGLFYGRILMIALDWRV